MPAELEAKLNEFLASAGPMRGVMERIIDWQNAHDAAHQELRKEVREGLESTHFRLRSLEAATGRGWLGVVRTALVVVLAAGGGYMARVAVTPPVAAAHP